MVNVRVGDDGKAEHQAVRQRLPGRRSDGYKFWGRPAYVHQMPDGAMLLSDEQTGAIYRISYSKPAAAKK